MEFELHGFLSSFLLYHLARRDKQDTLIENRMELKAVCHFPVFEFAKMPVSY